MKKFVLVFGLLVAVGLVSCMPYSKDPEYAMVPDEDGSWKLVNINEDPEPESFYNPETDIIFTLFTKENRQGHVLRWNDIESIRSSPFNPANPTRMTIHGWNGGGSPTGGLNGGIHRALFELGDFNCITMDWGAGAQTGNYLAARNRVQPSGTVAGNLLRLISIETGAELTSMSAIGHSLGAHVAGFIGKALGNRLGSVVALDAALPLFNINNPGGRVALTDAYYVESLHTNAGLLGFDEPIGHANFYPNFGRSQPGCGIDLSGNCAHGRAVHFFIESITTQTGFWSRQCRNYADITSGNCVSSGPDVRMGGEPLNSSSRGVFWLQTGAASPFALGRM